MTVTVDGMTFAVVATVTLLVLGFVLVRAPRQLVAVLVRDLLWAERDYVLATHGPGALVSAYDQVVRHRDVSVIEILAATRGTPQVAGAECLPGLAVDEDRRLRAWMALLSLTGSWTGLLLLVVHGFMRRPDDAHGMPWPLAVAFAVARRPLFAACSTLYVGEHRDRPLRVEQRLRTNR